MANYASEVLVNGQAIVTAKYQQFEQRRQMPSVFELALKNQHISIPDAQALRVSPLRTVDVNFFNNIVAGAGTAKAYNHSGTYGDSTKVNITYVQYVETFSLPRKIAFNSIATYTQMFANLYEMKWKNLRTRHDNAALSYVYTNRNQLDAGTMATRLATAGLGSYWDATNFALSLPSTLQPLFIAQLKAAMFASFYEGRYDVICDVQMATLFENYMNQGAGNFSNTSWQFADCNFARTQQNIDPAFTAGVCLALPEGQLAGLCWNEGLNVQGVFEDIGGPIGTLTTVEDPFGSGAVADLSIYTQRSDTSANTSGGSTEDINDQYELTLTVGYALPPLTLANDSTALEVVMKSAVV